MLNEFEFSLGSNITDTKLDSINGLYRLSGFGAHVFDDSGSALSSTESFYATLHSQNDDTIIYDLGVVPSRTITARVVSSGATISTSQTFNVQIGDSTTGFALTVYPPAYTDDER